MSLIIYGDIISQPVRAVWGLCLANPTKVTDWKRVDIRLSKGDHKKAEMIQKNPNGKMPFMVEVQDGQEKMSMFESHAMMKYICASRKLDDHWYPTSDGKDVKM